MIKCFMNWILKLTLNKPTKYSLDEALELRMRGFYPLECENSHMPGDCPLCGAK